MKGDHAALGLSGVGRSLVDEGGIQFGVHLGACVIHVCSVEGQRHRADETTVLTKKFNRVQCPDEGIIRGQDHGSKTDIGQGHPINVQKRCRHFSRGNRTGTPEHGTAQGAGVRSGQFGGNGIETAIFGQGFKPG